MSESTVRRCPPKGTASAGTPTTQSGPPVTDIQFTATSCAMSRNPRVPIAKECNDSRNDGTPMVMASATAPATATTASSQNPGLPPRVASSAAAYEPQAKNTG